MTLPQHVLAIPRCIRGLMLIAAIGLAATTPAGAQSPAAISPTADTTLTRARRLATWVLDAEAESLWMARAPSLTAGMFQSRDSLTAALTRIRGTTGERVATLEERLVWSDDRREYWQVLQTSALTAPILLRVMLEDSGQLAGLGLGSAMQVPLVDSGGPVIRDAGATGPSLLADPYTLPVLPAAASGVTIRVDTTGVGTITRPAAANYRGAFSPDGRDYYFFRRVGAGESYRIFVAHREGGVWSSPEELDLGGPHSDLYPTVSPDGEFLVFASYRPLPGASLPQPNAHLWISRRSGGRWSSPEPITGLNEPGLYHPGPRFLPNGDLRWRVVAPGSRELRRASCIDGRCGQRTVDPEEAVWRARLPEGHVLWEVTLDPAGTLAILDVGVRAGAPSNLWVSVREGTGWSSPVPLPREINTAVVENFAVFTPDGEALHFVRDFGAVLEVRTSVLREYARRRRP